MSDSEDESTENSGSSSEEDEDNSGSSTMEENENDEDENESSSDGIVELIQVGDVRTAFSMATGGKNCCTLEQFPSVLDTLSIKLNEKRTMEFFTMLDEDATNEVGWNAMFYALRDGQSKFKGLPMDQVVGGLLYEFEQSARGVERKKAVAKKSMISFLQKNQISFNNNTNINNNNNNTNTVTSPTNDKQAGMTKPIRKITSGAVIMEDEEEEYDDDGDGDVINDDNNDDDDNDDVFDPTPLTVTRTRAVTAAAVPPPHRPLLKNKSSGSADTKRRSSIKASYENVKIKSNNPVANILSDSLRIQEESLYKLYNKISFIEETLRSKYKNEDVVSGMNNVMLLQNAINGIAKSSVQSLKEDINNVLNKSAIHSSHQVAKEISSQLTRMNHTINNTNKLLSAQSGANLTQKLHDLESYLNNIDITNTQMSQGGINGSRPSTANTNRFSRLNSAKSVHYPYHKSMHTLNNKSLIAFEFDPTKLMDGASEYGIDGIYGMDKDDIETIIDDMELIKKSVSSLDDCLQKIISQRLLKLEKTVFALFGQIASNKKDTYQLMPVEELATQLDLQKANFEAEIRKSKLKANELEKLLQHTKDTAFREKQAAIDERERLLIALGKFLQQEAVVTQLRAQLKKKLGIKLKDMVNKNNNDNDSNKNDNNNNDEKKEEDNDDDDEKDLKIDIVSADKHINLNNYLPDSKYDDQTGNYEKKLHSQKEKLQMKALKSILEYKSVDDIPKIDDDEIPDFLLNNENNNDHELEQQLGFGYEELLRLYRANTHLNIQLSFAKWEKDELNNMIKDIKQPLIINTLGKATEISFQLKLQSYIDQINVKKVQLHDLKSKDKEMGLIDKYRLQMYRDSRREEMEIRRDLREDKLEILRQKRMIKKLFEQTKLRGNEIMEQAIEMRSQIKQEIEEYSLKKHEMVLAKAKYQDKMNKNKVEMEEQIINEEIAKSLEIYKQHLEDEAHEKMQEQLEEELESEKEILTKQFAEKMEELHEDIEMERIEYEKEIKHLKNELKNMQNRMDETMDAQQKYMQRTNEIRKEKSNLSGQLKESQLLYKELSNEFTKYKQENNNDNESNDMMDNNYKKQAHHQQYISNHKGPIDPQAIYAGYYEPSEELKQARGQYKKMKMASDQQQQQIKKLLREKAQLSEEIGRLEIDISRQRELVEKRDEEMITLQATFDVEVSSKLRPFVKLVETVGRDVLHNAPTNYIFNYKKQDFTDLENDLYRDRSDWYIHKNHILRSYFFSIEEWFRDHFWLHERIVQCNSSVHEAMQQVLKDTWMETRIQTHAFIRWFGDLDNEQELKLFYSVQFNNEERYFWNVDLFECIDDYKSGVIEKYYKDIVNEREERREGYWKRHPDVYQLYKQRYIETIKRYKKKLQEKKSHIEYIQKNKLDILQESDLNKIQQEFQKVKQQNKLKQMRNSQTIDPDHQSHDRSQKPSLRLSNNVSSQKRPGLLKRASSKSSNVHNQ